MQSDDFIYTLFGYKDVWELYFKWSGRIMANFFAISLLNISIKWILVLFQTLAMTGLLYFTSQISNSTTKLKFGSWAFVLISSIYWLYHPDLGQSTFWVVGAAVYMWTSLVVCLFLWYLFKYYYSENEKYLPKPIILYILAFFAGCTNENLGVLVAGISGILLLQKWFVSKKIDTKFLISSILSGLGALILILAPGNQKRLKAWEYNNNKIWGDIPIMEKWEMFENKYWEFFSVPILLLIGIYLLLFFLKKISLTDENRRITHFSFSLIFLGFSFISYEILFLSPIHPNRSASGSFFLLLLALSFAFIELVRSVEKKKYVNYVPIVISITFLCCFIGLFFNKILPLYSSYYAQSKIQIQQIDNALISESKDNKIPRLFIDKELFDERLNIDNFENPKAFAEYYGLSTVEFYDVDTDLRNVEDFDVLLDGSLRVQVEITTKKAFKLVLAYKDGTNENFDGDHKIWKQLKSLPDSSQIIEYILPVGVKIQNLRLDIDGKDTIEFQLNKMKIYNNRRDLSIQKEDFQKYFVPNKSIDFEEGKFNFQTDMNHMRGVWPYFSETEKLNAELRKFF